MIFVRGSVTNKRDSVAGLHIDPYNKDEVASAIKSAYASPPAGPRICTSLEISAGDKVPVFTQRNKDDHFNSNDKRSKSADNEVSLVT